MVRTGRRGGPLAQARAEHRAGLHADGARVAPVRRVARAGVSRRSGVPGLAATPRKRSGRAVGRSGARPPARSSPRRDRPERSGRAAPHSTLGVSRPARCAGIRSRRGRKPGLRVGAATHRGRARDHARRARAWRSDARQRPQRPAWPGARRRRLCALRRSRRRCRDAARGALGAHGDPLPPAGRVHRVLGRLPPQLCGAHHLGNAGARRSARCGAHSRARPGGARVRAVCRLRRRLRRRPSAHAVARSLLLAPPAGLDALRDAWLDALAGD